MELPEYITKEEVQRVCREIGLSDWTQLTNAKITLEEAKIIQESLGGEASQISSDEFRRGLEVELEHGLTFTDANVTNNHPLLTGKIVKAHLKEMLDYYLRLEVAELEGDLFKAAANGDGAKLLNKYQKLIDARMDLCISEKANR
ncbi:MAG: hypothetical protein KKD01_16375 [Proteobacteria bacterium]|nr:hypothetical protein [Pseudomonadota bacterium]MBU1419430.1 hypothetical protein [Pseudomonadota bacterium]MBU1456301.1 hypothetical protein [Pseudomonadota bacterium]